MARKKQTQEQEGKQQKPRRDYGDGSVYQRQDGRYAASLRLPNKKRKYFYGKTEKEVKQKLKAAQHKLEQGIQVTAGQELFATHMQHWLRVKRAKVKDGTYAYYRSYTESHLLPSLGHLKLEKVTAEHIQALYEHLDGTIAANTTRLIHTMLRSAFYLAIKMKKLLVNPMDLVTPPRAMNEEIHPLSKEQVRRLLEVAKDHPHRNVLILALATGMRRGELLALTWDHVNLEKKTLTVAASLSYRNPDKTGHCLKVEEPKTAGSRRTLRLSKPALEALEQQKRIQQEHGQWDDHGIVFPNRRGGYFQPELFRLQFKRFLKKAGLPKTIRFHDLRHTCATLLLERGVNAIAVQKLLGHSSVTITLNIYGHVTPNLQEQVVNQLDAYFNEIAV